MSLATNISDFATRVGTEFKAVYAKLGTLTSLNTTTKTSLVDAINEVNSKPSGGAAINDAAASTTTVYSSSKTDSQIATKPSINDTTASTTTVYSSSKTNSAISAAVSALVASAPSALDTLNELSAALGNDANFATTINTALGNRVRFDAAQTLTAGQLTQVQANIGVTSSANVGDTTTNYVTTFEAALV